MPSIVTRPLITNMAWIMQPRCLRLVLLSSKVRQVRSVRISGMGFAEFCLGVNLVSYKSPLDFTPNFGSSFGEGIVMVKGFIRLSLVIVGWRGRSHILMNNMR